MTVEQTPRVVSAEELREAAITDSSAETMLDNGNGARSKPSWRRGKKKLETPDTFDVDVEAAPEMVDPGIYDVKVERLERWEFFRGKKGERQPKITLWCVIYGGQFNGIKLPMRMNYDVPIRRGSKLCETITVATFPDVPKRASRISLRKLFTERVFKAEVRTLISPYRDKNWKPILGNDDKPKEKARTSIVDCLLEAMTGPKHDYLL